jgi:excisionase family DNA binding protein
MRYLVTMTIDIEEVPERRGRAPRPMERPAETPKPETVAPPLRGPIQPMVYGLKDVAKLLGISRSSVYILLKEGQLSPVRIGRRILFTEGDLRSFVERQRKE